VRSSASGALAPRNGLAHAEESLPLLRHVVAMERREEKVVGEVTFEIDRQLAGAITNVGGDQNTFLGDTDGRGAVIARAIATVGLMISVTGLGFLVVGGIETGRALPPPDWAQYNDYVATNRLTVAVILIVAGIVIGKIGRLFARR
jgi:hypothetical protein